MILRDGDSTSYPTSTTSGTSMVDTDGSHKRSYIRFKVGDQYVLLQWGQTTINGSPSGDSNTVYFPKSYTSSHYPAVLVTPKSTSISKLVVTGHSSTTFTVNCTASSSDTYRIFWLAICCG